MTLTLRTKLLIGIALAVAAYVTLGQKESDPAEPVEQVAFARPSHVAATASRRPHSLQSFLPLAHRVVGGPASESLFAAHSWYVAPPTPPPAPPPSPTVSAPAPPVAPPLPFAYMGSYAPNGAQPVFFLTRADRVYDVKVGDTLDDTYHVDGFSNGQLLLTYKPLNIQQQLATTGANP